MPSNKPVQVFKSIPEILRELSNLKPDDCLQMIAKEMRSRLECETACILLWHEVWSEDRTKRRVLVTEYPDGLPPDLKKEVYLYGEGITGGYIFSEQRTIRAIIDLDRHEIHDEEAGGKVEVKDTKWHRMELFGSKSKNGFKSLLGLPLVVKNQRIGVVKLINKLDQGFPKETGFDNDDLRNLKNFLSTIELVIETKTYEKQIASLFSITQKITSADFDYDQLLQEIATTCADALNQRLCIVRMLDHKNLRIKGCSEPEAQASFDDFTIPARVIQSRRTICFDGQVFHTLGSPSKPYRTKLPAVFNSLDFKINSMLAVPVIYQKKAVGVIECYASLSPEFSSRMVDAIKAYGTLAATLFQRNKIKEAIDSLNRSFSLLESSEKIYESVITSIEQYLDTTKISIWEKKAKENGFSFDLVKASKSFERSYRKNRIKSLNENSRSARAANANKIEHLSRARLKRGNLQYADFIESNNLQSLTIVPITAGRRVQGVINVFYEDDRILLKEEEYFLRLLARKAAAAIWNKELTLSFNAINEKLMEAPNMETILKHIADEARRVLYAEPVIIFPNDPDREELLRPELAGKVKGRIYSGKEKQQDFVTLMLEEPNPIYLESTDEYRKFCKSRGSLRPSKPDDFWGREGIQSLAAVRLVARPQKPVGVMFFNYKAPHVFDDSTKNAIQSFAARAASAIVSASFTGTRIQEMANEQIIRSVLSQLADVVYGHAVSGNDPELVILLSELQKNLNLALGHFDSESRWRRTTIRRLIDEALDFFPNRLETRRIDIKRNYGKKPLNLPSDTRRIPWLLREVVAILLDAKSPTPGSLTISTRLKGDRINAEFLLAGGRVSDKELQVILGQGTSASAKDNPSLPGRFELCEQLALSVAGEIEISPTKDGLKAKVSLPIE